MSRSWIIQTQLVVAIVCIILGFFVIPVCEYNNVVLPGWIYIITLSLSGLYLGADVLDKKKREDSTALAKLSILEAFSDQNNNPNIDNKIIPLMDLQYGVRATAYAEMGKLNQIENLLIKTPKWVVVTELKSLANIDRIIVITRLLKETISKVWDDGTVPIIILYSTLTESMDKEKGDLGKWQEKFLELRTIVSGQWYYLPYSVFPKGHMIWNEYGCMYSKSSDHKDWMNLAKAECIRQAANELFNEDSGTITNLQLPIIVSLRQLIHLSELGEQWHEDHYGDYTKNGFHFGKFGDLMIRPKSKILGRHTMKAFQYEEDNYFSRIMDELLLTCDEVTAYWPLIEESLSYITSEPIESWHKSLADHLFSGGNKSVVRYLLVWVNEDANANLTLLSGNWDDNALEKDGVFELDLPNGEKHSTRKVPYNVIVECVIGRFMWHLLDKRLKVKIIPAVYENLKGTQDEFVYSIKRMDPTAIEIGERNLKQGLGKDWIMIKSQKAGLSSTVIQYDEAVESRHHLYKKDDNPTKLLVHRYLFNNGKSYNECNECGQCSLPKRDKLAAGYCCLGKVLSKLDRDNRFSPQNLQDSELLKQICERIASRGHDFYTVDDDGKPLTWDNLLDRVKLADQELIVS